MYATLASRDVDCCLIPESPFYLEGKGGLFEYIEDRLKENGHMVIVIAEGAGQELLSENQDEKDASGNKLLKDVGLWMSHKIKVCIYPNFKEYWSAFNHDLFVLNDDDDGGDDDDDDNLSKLPYVNYRMLLDIPVSLLYDQIFKMIYTEKVQIKSVKPQIYLSVEEYSIICVIVHS